jgi:ribosomal protein S18 acetylase RimI-like enzyme
MQRRQRDHDASIPLSPSLLHLPREAGMTPRVRAGAPEDLEELAALFDQYRQFYGQPPDLALAREFIGQRLARGDSRLLIAQGAGARIIGFCQLYPSLCSVAAGPILVLYDLFVVPAVRRRGAGRALLEAAAEHARASGAVRMELATARTNVPAQSLYESLGWVRDEVFLHYSLAIPR